MFVARRGVPAVIRSDNGTNLVGTRSLIHRIFAKKNTQALYQYARQKGGTWILQTPLASSQSGSWEAVVKLFKGHMKRTIGRRLLSKETLRVFITSCEAAINSRPLVESPDPAFLAITPAHLLCGRPLTSLPEPTTDAEMLAALRGAATPLAANYRLMHQMRMAFWTRFLAEYVVLLQNRQKDAIRVRDFMVGDIVLVVNSNLPRLRWATARIEAVFPGADGVVRNVRVRDRTGAHELPANRLALLEETNFEERRAQRAD